MRMQPDTILDKDMLKAALQGIALALALPMFLIIAWLFSVAMGA